MVKLLEKTDPEPGNRGPCSVSHRNAFETYVTKVTVAEFGQMIVRTNPTGASKGCGQTDNSLSRFSPAACANCFAAARLDAGGPCSAEKVSSWAFFRPPTCSGPEKVGTRYRDPECWNMSMNVKAGKFALLASLLSPFLFLTLSQLNGDQNFLARVVLATCGGMFIFILLDSILDRSCSILLILVSYYHVFMFILPGMLHCAQGWFPFFDTMFDSEQITYVAFLLLLYSISFLCGYVIATSTYPSRLTISKPTVPSDSKIVFFAIISIPCIIASMALAGLPVFLERRGDLDLLVSDATPLYLVTTNLPRSLAFCCVMMIFGQILTPGSKSLWRYLLFLLLPAVLALSIISNNPLTLSRFQLFAIILCLLFISKLLIIPIRKALFASSLVIGQLLIFPLIDVLARGEAGQAFHFDPVDYLSTAGDFDGLQSLLNTYTLVQSEGLSYGKQLLGAILTFIPRRFLA